MEAPAFEYETLFHQHNAQVFYANFALHGDMSNRVMTILSDCSPDAEVYSIDECFLKLDGLQPFDLLARCEQMHGKVAKCTGIPVGIGIAPTQALSWRALLCKPCSKFSGRDTPTRKPV